MTGLGASRIAACSSSIGSPMVPRPSYWPSCADWSPPVQKALSPDPASTIAATARSQAARCSAWISSSQVRPRNAFRRAGRSMKIHSAAARRSTRMSS